METGRENSTASSIVCEVRGGVGTIAIERATHFNSLDLATARDLRRAGLRMARDESVRAVILRGTPGVFCSGADLKYVAAGGKASDLGYLGAPHAEQAQRAGDVLKEIVEYIHSAISEIRRAPKPFVAAVDGIAAAGGFGIAMACDLVIASQRASFEWAYGRTGLTGAESLTFMLPRIVGLRRAMEMVFLSPRLNARRALDFGLINAIHPVEEFEAQSAALGEQLATGPTEAWAEAKLLINQACGMDQLDGHLDRELDALNRVANGPGFAAGLAQFLTRKSPKSGEK
ncbi:MAG TPA: enoyl-CoA hydratase-related protein [Candidatus Binataceae bacterium]|nr:enoyl-CoA hydratase-related protein [Candidatus Binataceae bacterium]